MRHQFQLTPLAILLFGVLLVSDCRWAAFGQTVVNLGAIQTVTGPSDLDLEGEFPYAINFKGPNLTVDDVLFLSDATAMEGVTLVGPHGIAEWLDKPEFGSGANNDNLETIFHSIRWAYGQTESLEAHLEVVPGATYKLQLLMSANGPEYRVWDVEIEGVEALDEISSLGLLDAEGNPPDYAGPGAALAFVCELTAADGSLDIRMADLFGNTYREERPDGTIPIRGPIWQGLTLELVWPVGDADEDGMPGLWELEMGLNPDLDDAAEDPDGDGLTNLEEYERGTRPGESDTDRDGLDDRVETGTNAWLGPNDTGTNPTQPDSDGDGLLDGVETNTGTFRSASDTGTNPLDADTDDDAFDDGLEVRVGRQPLDPNFTPVDSPWSNLLAWWDFDDAADPERTVDVMAGVEGLLLGGATFTPEGGGVSGAGADRAVDFGTGDTGEQVAILNVDFLDLVADQDVVTFSFWLKLREPSNNSAFAVQGPGTGASALAVNVHTPWDDMVYFDTAGCCDPESQRLAASITQHEGYTDETFLLHWRHFVFVKQGRLKQVWVDGSLLVSGTDALPLPKSFTAMILGAQLLASYSVRGWMDDFAVFARALNETQIAALAMGWKPTDLDRDSDSDGMPDLWEEDHGLDLTQNDAGEDPDQDGLGNGSEFLRQTDPQDPDTDDDGLIDGVETRTGRFLSATDTGTDPRMPDTDEDGLPDGVETATGDYAGPMDTGTDPHRADTDGDGLGDGLELRYDTDPLNPASTPLAAGGPALLACWEFNEPEDHGVTTDAIAGIVGMLRDGATLTPDGGGVTGAPGDRAIDLGVTGGRERMEVFEASFLNLLALRDEATISFWLRLREPSNNTAFWAVAPSAGESALGMQAHVPWYEGIYFDTTGCCERGRQRLLASISQHPGYTGPDFFLEWHHFAFIKEGATKSIWVDGQFLGLSSGALSLPDDFTSLIVGSQPLGQATVNGWMDDFAVFGRALAADELAYLAGGISPLDLAQDRDGDGMLDLWEAEHGLDIGRDDSAEDPDEDGVDNLGEFTRDTHPRDADTDDDGLKDGVETGTGIFVDETDTGTDPKSPDTDQDSLLDSVETGSGTFSTVDDTGTNPLTRDTDGDGFDDGAEVQLESDPTTADEIPIDPQGYNLLACWTFDDLSDPTRSVDEVHGLVGDLENGAGYSPESAGRSGLFGDRALDLDQGLNREMMRVSRGEFLNATSVRDEATWSVWIRMRAPGRAVAFHWRNPSICPGAAAYVPEGSGSSGDFSFRTAGCSNGPEHTLSDSIWNYAGFSDESFYADWHHYAFVKRGVQKQLWVDGVLWLEGNQAAPLTGDFAELLLGAEPSDDRSFDGLIDEFAVFGRALDGRDIAALAAGTSPLDFSLDADLDGMPDQWEKEHGLDLSLDDSLDDPDEDGLPNLGEFPRRTDPRNSDTDGDGYGDRVETGTRQFVDADDTGSDPLNPDTDGDTLIDSVETGTGQLVDASDTGSNPNLSDTDQDGVPDDLEVILATNPSSSGEVPVAPGRRNLLALWDFNTAVDDQQTVDVIHGFKGLLEDGAAYTEGGGGRSGLPDDRAMSFGIDGGDSIVRVADGRFVNAAAVLDQVTFTFWLKLASVRDASPFWVRSPSSNDFERGAQAHVPFYERLYFDTAGCCASGGHRLTASLTRFPEYTGPEFLTEWRHFAFVKDGRHKEIWIDGAFFIGGGSAFPLPGDMAELTLGGRYDRELCIQGWMDDFAVFASPLSADAIALLAGGASPKDLPEPGPPTVTLRREGDNLVLRWTGTLQEMRWIGGFWIDLNNVSSPLTIAPGGEQRYYRARR